MRRLFFAATGLFAVLLAAPHISVAGNALLPPSSGSSSTTPNLGLGPSTSSGSSSTAVQQETPAPAVQAPTPLPTPEPAATTSNITTATDADVLKAFGGTIGLINVDTASQSQLPPGTMPTQVMQSPDLSAEIAQAFANMPYVLMISISPKSSYSVQDIQTIAAKLGLSREQIPSACVLTVRGVMITDKDTSIIDGPISPQVPVRYDGNIKSLVMSAQAYCFANRLPSGAGIISQVGNRFVVPLHAINCPPPSRKAAQLSIVYNGTDTAQCSY